MAAATPTLLSLEEYLHTSFEPDCDFVDGELVGRDLGKYPHSKLQSLITSWLQQHAAEWGIDPTTEQRINVSASRVRVADVSVSRADDPYEEVTTTAPLLCIELLSPEDRLFQAKVVLEDYRQMGVKHTWLIDPFHRCAYIYDEAGLRLTDTVRMEVTGTPIYIPLDDLFVMLDRKRKGAA